MTNTARDVMRGLATMAALMVACVLALALAAPSRALADDDVLVVRQAFTMQGVVPPEVSGTFDYELTRLSDEAPLPASATGGVYHFPLTGDDVSLSLPLVVDGTTGDKLSFAHAGVYEYRITCTTTPSDDRMTVDTTPYVIRVSIENDDSAAHGLKVGFIEIFTPEGTLVKKAADVLYKHSYKGSAATIAFVDPPVRKRILGGVPASDAVFRFALTADDPSFPMPAGSSGGAKTVQITGEGEVELGTMTFTNPGTYAYTLRELDDGVKGYTYDTTEWRIEIVMTSEGSRLVLASHVYKDGTEVTADACTFENAYEGKQAPLPQRIARRLLPKTGDSLWGLLQVCGALVVAGGIGLGMGIARKVRERKARV